MAVALKLFLLILPSEVKGREDACALPANKTVGVSYSQLLQPELFDLPTRTAYLPEGGKDISNIITDSVYCSITANCPELSLALNRCQQVAQVSQAPLTEDRSLHP